MKGFDFSGLTPALILDAIESQGIVVDSWHSTATKIGFISLLLKTKNVM